MCEMGTLRHDAFTQLTTSTASTAIGQALDGNEKAYCQII